MTMDKFGHYGGVHGLNHRKAHKMLQPDFGKDVLTLKNLVKLIFTGLKGLQDNFKESVMLVFMEHWEQELKKKVDSTIETKIKEIINDESALVKSLRAKNKAELKSLAGTIRKYALSITAPKYKRKTEAAEIEIQNKLKSDQTTWVDAFPEFPVPK